MKAILKKVKVGSGHEESFKERLVSFLREYKHVFAWNPRDMPGLHESIAMHNLDVNPNKKPVKQKRRNFAPERQRAIDEKVEKLFKAGINKKIKYPQWLANVVMVKKSNGKWRICVDYTDFNDACPKDPYPLPNIDQLIDATGVSNKKEVNWSPECQKAFEEIKSYISQPSVLTKAQPGEPLYLYLSAGAQAVGAALIREENGKQQPVYYVSQVLKDAENRYPRLENFAFALVTTLRKLRHYFQGREIRVVTNQPLRKIIHKPYVSRRLVDWVVELSQFNLSFIPRTAIKAQILADFIIECNFPEEEPKPMNIDPETNQDANPGAWTLKVDGSSIAESSGAGLILKSPEEFTIQTAISFSFPATNNQAEYEALIAGLKLSRTLRVRDLKIYSGS
ncbi:uncharacterized protein LOC141696257 [Apium graveolens]|uniref:uncharacterized protein LOC141696257 n=1 Tax=Apium graveolens TaxID=4045 RepID=UPI003D7BD3B7